MKITKDGIAVIENDTHISRWIEESGRLDHDQNVLPIILPYIPEGGIVVDAGSYLGDHTIAYLNKVGLKGIVLSFEPFQEAMECQIYNLKDYSNIVFCSMALGSKAGFVKTSCTNNNFGMTTVEESEEGIEVMRLDDCVLFQELKLDFLKIDCEGMEIDVLQGAKETIEKFKPVMFIEVNEHTLKAKGYTKNDLLQTIHDLGYTYRNVYEEQGLDDEQFDVLCFPK